MTTMKRLFRQISNFGKIYRNHNKSNKKKKYIDFRTNFKEQSAKILTKFSHLQISCINISNKRRFCQSAINSLRAQCSNDNKVTKNK